MLQSEGTAMADIFLSEDVTKLFHNKFVVVIGDSGNIVAPNNTLCFQTTQWQKLVIALNVVSFLCQYDCNVSITRV